MTRICEKCNFENQDDYDFCAKCGNPLVEGLSPKNVYVFRAEQPQINKQLLALTYLVTIFLSWGGAVFGLLTKNSSLASFSFFGFFVPFYLVQSRDPRIKIHGAIQFIISLFGILASLYILLI